MLRFHAISVECFSEFEEVLTVNFDNQADEFEELCATLGWVFRKFRGYRVVDDDAVPFVAEDRPRE
jgi:hypothetical protein